MDYIGTVWTFFLLICKQHLFFQKHFLSLIERFQAGVHAVLYLNCLKQAKTIKMYFFGVFHT